MLGRQQISCIRLLRCLAGHNRGPTSTGPAVAMWRDHERAALRYAHCTVREWELRGWEPEIVDPSTEEGARFWELPLEWLEGEVVPPEWLGQSPVHTTHRAALLHEYEEWYGQFGWEEVPQRGVFWPPPIPRPGDWIVSEANVVLQVHSVRAGVVTAREDRPGAPSVSVPVRDIVHGRWRRAIGL